MKSYALKALCYVLLLAGLIILTKEIGITARYMSDASRLHVMEAKIELLENRDKVMRYDIEFLYSFIDHLRHRITAMNDRPSILVQWGTIVDSPDGIFVVDETTERETLNAKEIHSEVR